MKKVLGKFFAFAVIAVFLLHIPSTAEASWHLQRLLQHQGNQSTVPTQPAKPNQGANSQPSENNVSIPTESNNRSTADLIRSLRGNTQPTQNNQNTGTVPEPSNPTPETNPPKSGGGQPSTNNMATQMLDMVNNERVKQGLQPLKWHAQLASLAYTKSDDMVRNNYFSHTSPTYGSFYQMVRNAGIPYRQVGENIAMSRNVQSAFYQFMGSQGHRQNILSPHLTHIGIGIVQTQNGIVVTQLFIAQ